MRKVIYSCDKCGFETEDITNIWYFKLVDAEEKYTYIKMLCTKCGAEIKRLIDEKGR